jgi:hypothetical protein
MIRLIGFLVLFFSAQASAQIMLSSEKYSDNFKCNLRLTTNVLWEDSSGYYLRVNDDNLSTYQHLNRSMEIDRKEIISSDQKRTQRRQPYSSFCCNGRIIELSYRINAQERTITWYAQHISRLTLKPENEAVLIYTKPNFSAGELMRDDETYIPAFSFAFSETGFCLINYSPDSFAARNMLLRYELYICNDSLKTTAVRAVQVEPVYMLNEIKHFNSGKVLINWRKRINPKHEPDLLMLASASVPGFRNLRPDLKGNEVHDFYVQELMDGEIAVAGYYIDPALQATMGVFLFIYDKTTSALIRSSINPVDIRFHYAGATPEQKASRAFLHSVVEIFEADSNRIVLLGEYTSYEVLNSSLRIENNQMRGIIRNKNDKYIHGSSFAYCFDEAGNLAWANLIPVNQLAGFGEGLFISTVQTFYNNSLYIVYNDAIDGHIQGTTRKTARISENCQQTLVCISIDGKIRKEELRQQIKYQRVMPYLCKRTTTGLLLVNRTPVDYSFLELKL